MERTLTIHKVIAGGKGLGRLEDGMVVMTTGVLPGETVTVRLAKKYRNHQEADLLRVVEPSDQRIDPPCPLYGRCGGCNLQHARPETQLTLKEAILRESLERAHLECDGIFQPALASPRGLGYRFRLRLHLDQQGQIGFHRSASNTVVPVQRCLLATEPLNQAIAGLIDQGLPQRLAGLVAAVELLQSPDDDRIILALEPRAATGPAQLSALLPGLSETADAVVFRPPPGRTGEFPEVPAELSQSFSLFGRSWQLRWDHRCFFQVNALQNPRLIAAALELIKTIETPPASGNAWNALDLFCGAGNFSLPLGILGRTGARVTGIEANPHAVFWASRNAQEAGLADARFFAADVGKRLHALVKQQARFHTILFDPPRQGLGKAAALLPRLKARQIIAVSCDPATLARDLALLVQGGYRLRSIRAVDMFPQTHHIEAVALLERI
ncbi:MAG: class I SAM-dependent RNA methyltransferase [Desulfobulbus sp.]|jgi:23S rRNA (uracil1939-C5)-methyltransferase